MYRKHFGTIPVKVQNTGDQLGVDVAAAWTKDRKGFTVGIVNPQPAPTSLVLKFQAGKLSESGTMWQVAGEDPSRRNDVGNKTQLKIVEQAAKLSDSLLVPGFSISIYRFDVK